MLYTDSISTGPTLIVGAPNYGDVANPQKGKVFFVNMTKLAENSTKHGKDLEISSYAIFEGLGRMTKFGWSVAVVDLNKDGVDDVAISAPSSGVYNGF